MTNSSSLILVHSKKEALKKAQHSLTMKKWYKKNGDRQRQKMRQWYRKNPDWYEQYRKDNPEKIRLAFQRYKNTPKGQKAIKKYEQTSSRRASKAFWNFKQRLQRNVDSGKISKREMNKRIKKRLREKPV